MSTTARFKTIHKKKVQCLGATRSNADKYARPYLHLQRNDIEPFLQQSTTNAEWIIQSKNVLSNIDVMAKPPVWCWGRWCYIFGGRDCPSWVSVVRQKDWFTILLSKVNKGAIAIEKIEILERPPHSLNFDSLCHTLNKLLGTQWSDFS